MNDEQSWPQFFFRCDTVFLGQTDSLTTALCAKKMSDELPPNSLNLWEICFFFELGKRKTFILTCSNWWFAAALAPVFFRYSDQSKLRFCQFSPTSLGRKEKGKERKKKNHIKPETNTCIMRQKVLTTSYTQSTTSESFIWQIGKKTTCNIMKCIDTEKTTMLNNLYLLLTRGLHSHWLLQTPPDKRKVLRNTFDTCL